MIAGKKFWKDRKSVFTDRSNILGRELQDIRAPALINVGGQFRNYSDAGKLSYKEDNARGCFSDNIDEGTIGVESSLRVFLWAYSS